ncbi:hypothetical protein OSTOST_23782, partial [Ostertagia ostertagi]
MYKDLDFGSNKSTKLLNHTEKYLLLDFMFGQNPSYFDDYIDDVRYILSFSPSIRVKGDHLIDSLKITRLLIKNVERDFLKKKRHHRAQQRNDSFSLRL